MTEITSVRSDVVVERARWARKIERPHSTATTPRKMDSRFGPVSPPWPGSLLVTVESDDGLTGWGLGGGGMAGKIIVDTLLKPIIMGQDPNDKDRLWEWMHHANLRYAQAGIVLMAMSGIDLALWDLCGKLEGKPVYELLGGKVKESVPVYATVREPGWVREHGFWGCKLGGCFGPADGLEGMRANERAVAQARASLGQDVRLMLDISSRWTVPYAQEMLRILAPYDLYFCEEPVPPWDIEGYATLRRTVTSTRIVGGEHAFTRHTAQRLLEAEAVDILQPDIRWTGGLSEVLKIIDLADQHGIPVWPHRGAMAWSMHAILSRDACPMAEGMCLTKEEAELSLFDGEPLPKRGMVTLSDAPGFGLTLRPEKLQALRIDS